jgi:hypothetical protein
VVSVALLLAAFLIVVAVGTSLTAIYDRIAGGPE